MVGASSFYIKQKHNLSLYNGGKHLLRLLNNEKFSAEISHDALLQLLSESYFFFFVNRSVQN